MGLCQPVSKETERCLTTCQQSPLCISTTCFINKLYVFVKEPRNIRQGALYLCERVLFLQQFRAVCGCPCTMLRSHSVLKHTGFGFWGTDGHALRLGAGEYKCAMYVYI